MEAASSRWTAPCATDIGDIPNRGPRSPRCARGATPSSRRYHRIMRALVIADDYDPETEPPRAEMVSRHRLDAVIITGDLSQSALAGIDTLAVPSMGRLRKPLRRHVSRHARCHRPTPEQGGASGHFLCGPTTTSCTTQDEYRTLVDSLPLLMSSSTTARRGASTTTPTPLTSGSTRCATG